MATASPPLPALDIAAPSGLAAVAAKSVGGRGGVRVGAGGPGRGGGRTSLAAGVAIAIACITAKAAVSVCRKRRRDRYWWRQRGHGGTPPLPPLDIAAPSGLAAVAAESVAGSGGRKRWCWWPGTWRWLHQPGRRPVAIAIACITTPQPPLASCRGVAWEPVLVASVEAVGGPPVAPPSCRRAVSDTATASRLRVCRSVDGTGTGGVCGGRGGPPGAAVAGAVMTLPPLPPWLWMKQNRSQPYSPSRGHGVSAFAARLFWPLLTSPPQPPKASAADGRRRSGACGRGRGGGCTTLAAAAADAVAAVSVCRSIDGTGIGGVGVSCSGRRRSRPCRCRSCRRCLHWHKV